MESVFERYLRCWNDVVSLARRPAAIAPFASIALAKIIAIVLMYFFWHPVFSGFMVPVLRTMGGERVLHFPKHARAFPEMFQAIEIAVMVLFGFAMIVWAVWLMADTLEGKKRELRVYAGHIAILTPSLIVVAIVFAGTTIGAPMALNWAAEQVEDHRPKLQLLFLTTAFVAAFVARVFLAYSPLYLRSGNGRPLAAMRDSFSYAREHLALTMLIVLTAMVPEKTLEYLASDNGVLVKNSRPDWIPILLIAKTVIEVFAWFFCFGAVTSKALDREPR